MVISQWAAANLDVSKDFITVIPEDKITDLEFVDGEIVKNRYYSVNNRPEIREYAESFAWKKVVEEYYVPAMEKIIAQYYPIIIEGGNSYFICASSSICCISANAS